MTTGGNEKAQWVGGVNQESDSVSKLCSFHILTVKLKRFSVSDFILSGVLEVGIFTVLPLLSFFFNPLTSIQIECVLFVR